MVRPDWPSALLQRPIEDANAKLHGCLTKALLETEAKDSMSYAERVEGVLYQMALSNTGLADAAATAAPCAADSEKGQNLMQLANAARFEYALRTAPKALPWASCPSSMLQAKPQR